MDLDLRQGDALELLRELPDASVDAVVTDPPYGLSAEPDVAEVLQHWLNGDDYRHRGGGFMGKTWDSFVPGPKVWAECHRVLKPGGHLVAFAGTRTQDLMTMAIRLGGFQIRDTLAWAYGSGFPKSRDVSKDLDRRDAKEASRQVALAVTAWIRGQGVTARQLDEATGTNMGGHYTTAASQPATPTRAHLESIRHLFPEPVPWWVEEVVDSRDVESPNYAARQVTGEKASGLSEGSGTTVGRFTDSRNERGLVEVTAAHTPLAQQWEGWGTALKPAMEPMILARKKPEGSIADNLVAHGVGALNIDGCRVESEKPTGWGGDGSSLHEGGLSRDGGEPRPVQGRFPANLLHDGSDEATVGLGGAARYFYCAKASRADRNDGLEHDLPVLGGGEATDRAEGSAGAKHPRAGAGRTGGSRNPHPTVKPTDLMEWVVRLVAPPGCTVLDPFVGSGSTGRGAARAGAGAFVAFDQSPEYLEVSRLRILATL